MSKSSYNALLPLLLIYFRESDTAAFFHLTLFLASRPIEAATVFFVSTHQTLTLGNFCKYFSNTTALILYASQPIYK